MKCTLALLTAVVLASSGCITVTGQSTTGIKEGLQETFLYRSVTAFDTGSGAGPFDANERLSES